MSSLERKRFNLQRLKEKERERAEQEEKEKERLNTEEREANKSRADSDSRTDEGDGSAKKKLVCRSISSTSNTSNLEGSDFDVDMAIEEGSWYDVFHDDVDVHEAATETKTVTPASITPARQLRSTSKSPVPKERNLSGDKPKRNIESIRRRLSCAGVGAHPETTPKSKPTPVKVQSPMMQKKKTPPSKTAPQVSSDMSDEKKPASLMSKLFTPGGQTSPKNLEAVNLVSLSHTRANDDHRPHAIDDKDQTRFSPSNMSTNTFLHIRSHIDDQLFSN
eukprot:CAMPEP_0114421098 /NCGR_PEP_ID=MMETSP0103-20121206/4900_1 /TAXON_ID=37642 ORGANISM="Paraphysomonas imperforata, Strain PA2" /NCGR_SAMPLE_ID=MMETSP0103 /ASSEMBLY_ACC=CAM_ASM_000201 /LENGTH=276 /DNA_ID=CAMNT_0001589603 /DNA_START=55 /DNA_END=885 /DNA_ORIENTATION=-